MGQDKLILRALEPGDIDAIYRWENAPEIWQHSAAHAPFSRHMLTQYVMEAATGDLYADKQLRLVAEVDGMAVGCVDLFDYDPQHHRAGVGILVDAACRKRGYGLRMLKAMAEYGHDVLQLHQIYCHVAEDNTASRHLFEKAGYRCCGELKEWIYDAKEQRYMKAYMYQYLM